MLNTEVAKNFKNWTCFNFHLREVFLCDGTFFLTPANQWQHNLFINFFVNNGKTKCTFKEFRDVARDYVLSTPDFLDFQKYYDFDHRKDDSINYGSIELTKGLFITIYNFLDNKANDSLESGLMNLIQALNKKDELIEQKFDNPKKKETFLKFLISMQEVVKIMDF